MSSGGETEGKWPDYDFEITLRPPGLQGSLPRTAVEEAIAKVPGVRRNGPDAFVLDAPLGRWMEITPETRTWNGFIGTRVDAYDNTVNCVRLYFPGNRRSPQLDRDYWRAAFAMAEPLGWDVWDDTYSNCWLSPEMVEQQLLGHEGKPPKPWWKFW